MYEIISKITFMIQFQMVQSSVQVMFQYNEWEGMHMELSGNPTDMIFLATSKDHHELTLTLNLLNWYGTNLTCCV